MKLFRKMKSGYRSIIHTMDKLNIDKSSRFSVFWDIVYCKIRFRCSYKEYASYNLHRYKNRHRKHFLFMKTRFKLYKKINGVERGGLHKSQQRQIIKTGISRDMILIPDAGEEIFLEFVRKYGKAVVKPDYGSCGLEVSLFVYENDEQALQFYRSLTAPAVCEEFICQHKEMASLHAASVNTIRVLALRDGENVNFISATLKIGGSATSIADNMVKGGMGAAVDIQTGIVKTFGYDLKNNPYTHHPISGKQIIGFQIPNWDILLKTIASAHKMIPGFPLLGWDVAVTENGVEIVEINSASGTSILQIMDQQPKGKYLTDYIKKHKHS